VIGTFITKKSAVAYWTALNTHGLTEQFSNTIFIQTPYLKRNKTIFGVPYKFVKISPNKRIGIIKQGYGNHSYPITDVEKTMVDCFDLPQYSGGYAELIRAFKQADLRSDNLIDYSQVINNKAVTKRMGYLAEFQKKKGLKTFIRFAKDQVNPKYNLFDPQGQDRGEFVSEWKLRLNISQDELLGIAQKQY
jgi:predicted transcriptional regulator of viral defense system